MKNKFLKITNYILHNKGVVLSFFNLINWLTLFIVFAIPSFFKKDFDASSFWLDFAGILYLLGHLSIFIIPIIIFIDKKLIRLNIEKLTNTLFLFFSYLGIILYIHFLIIIFFDQKFYPLVFFISGVHFSLLVLNRIYKVE